MPRSVSLSLLALALTTLTSSARAEGMGDAEVTRRLSFIEQHLESGTAAADRWWYGWYAGYSALTVGQFAIALAVDDPRARADNVVGAVASSLGVIPLGFFPFTPRSAAADLRVYPATTPAERRRKLAAAERLLHAASDVEIQGRSWITHALGFSVSIASGLVLGLGYHSTRGALLNSLGGVALTELQIFTQPTAAIGAWQAYELGQIEPPRTATNKPRWAIVPQGMGLGFAAVF
jgi:hypothetical protein